MSSSEKKPENKIGKLYGVGLGPGETGLVTIKALELLKKVPVIALPSADKATADGASGAEGAGGVARRILDELLDSTGEAELITLYLPMTKDEVKLDDARRAAANSVAKRLTQGEDVACVTLGDPMFFSTFSYLAPLCAELVEGLIIEVIPGVTAPTAAAAVLGEPLASAGESVAILPASYDMKRVEKALEEFDTVVLMKISKVMGKLLRLLDKKDLIANTTFIEKATWPEEVVVRDLYQMKEKAGYFSLLIVRKNKEG